MLRKNKNLLIVDGYNIIGTYFKENISLEAKRKKLLIQVLNCTNYKNYDKKIVFDSKQQSFDYSEKINDIEVIYSGYRKSADAIIENIVHSNSSLYDKIIVVTSDYSIQKVIFGLKNTIRKSSREFFQELYRQ